MTGVTESGFHWDVEEEVLDDWELEKLLIAVDRGSRADEPSVMLRLLGEEQERQLCEHCRGENGRVSRKAMFGNVVEILTALRTGKKS